MVKLRKSDGKLIDAEVGEEIIKYALPHDIVAKINGKFLVDLKRKIEEGFKEIEILDFKSDEGKKVFWHTSAHILAQAVKRIFPDAKLAIGHATDKGFFYEFDVPRPFTPEDLEKIEEEMKRIVKEDYEITREEVSKEKAEKIFEGERYKLELLGEIEEPKVSIYRQGEFVDLCTGPHLPKTGMVKAIKLLSTSSCFWKGIEGNPTLQRIYGVSFPSEGELEEFLRVYEEAKERDHKMLGRKLELFEVGLEEVGSGLVLWYPKGALLRNLIEDFLKKIHLENGYQLVVTPHIAISKLWEESGHLRYYKENMFVFEKDNLSYCIKPMNCPFHILIYKSKRRSYRELPIRYFELGTVYRYERSGTLHGLLRVRGFTQDDAHIFCREDQLEDEIVKILELMEKILGKFGFKKYEVELSLREPERPEKYMGKDENWIQAEEALRNALKRKGLKYKEAVGEAAFYGPKIDVKLLDAIGRSWQCPTIQVDFNLPERFNLTYVDENQKPRRVVMIHRTILGTIERFVGVLLENYKGALPLWISPIQVIVLPVTERNSAYAIKVLKKLKELGIRAEVDASSKTLNYRIREAELNKIPYILVVGDREEKRGEVAVRKRGEKGVEELKLEKFIEKILTQLGPEKTSF